MRVAVRHRAVRVRLTLSGLVGTVQHRSRCRWRWTGGIAEAWQEPDALITGANEQVAEPRATPDSWCAVVVDG